MQLAVVAGLAAIIGDAARLSSYQLPYRPDEIEASPDPRSYASVLIPGTKWLKPAQQEPGNAALNAAVAVLLPDKAIPSVDRHHNLALRIVTAEGGPGPNPVSSAAGYGQFLRGTWLEVFGRAYPDIAQKLSPEQILALREVKPLAVDMTERYAQENAKVLLQQGIETTDAVLSLAHTIGSGGAAKVLAAQQHQPVRELLSLRAISANRPFAEMTADDLQRWAGDRVAIAGATPPVPSAGAAAPRSEPSYVLAADYRTEGGRMASAVLRENQAHIARLAPILETRLAIDRDNPARPNTAVHVRSNVKPASDAGKSADREAIADVIAAVVRRPGYERFSTLSKTAQQLDRLTPSVLHSLALVLANKLHEENETLVRRSRHPTVELR